MPDRHGNFKGIAVPEVPWHKNKTDPSSRFATPEAKPIGARVRSTEGENVHARRAVRQSTGVTRYSGLASVQHNASSKRHLPARSTNGGSDA